METFLHWHSGYPKFCHDLHLVCFLVATFMFSAKLDLPGENFVERRRPLGFDPDSVSLLW